MHEDRASLLDQRRAARYAQKLSGVSSTFCVSPREILESLYVMDHGSASAALRIGVRPLKKAIEILNEWSSTLTAIEGISDRFLASGIYGYQFANAGEILRRGKIMIRKGEPEERLFLWIKERALA